LRKLMESCERRLQAFRAKLHAHTINPLEFHRRLCGLELAYALADHLRLRGFDEVYVPREGEAVTYRDGWLPLHGSDLMKFLKALSAAGLQRMYLQVASNYYFPTPSIKII